MFFIVSEFISCAIFNIVANTIANVIDNDIV